ncbi:MAG: autotransporter outer membrane beta-barrel domain-containing protein [Deltaproteobacteria bacterium]|nr:autotransporter outer membrane beta-barrel domain-containing protein [Deltaproteobacteria bacterium]
MTVNTAKLNGTMWFNLNNTTLNDPSTVLLTVTDKNLSQDPVDISGANILLSDFPAGPMLQPGDRFYLIDSGQNGNITKDQATQMASARQGMLLRYNFIIDDAVWPGDVSTARYLVARLPYRAPQVGDPPVVYVGSDVGEPLVVYVKTAVGNPLMVEIKEAVGDPLVAYFKEAVGDPLVVYVKDAVGEPLKVEVKSAVGNPEVVYFYSETGEPLFKLLTDMPLNPNSEVLLPNVPYVGLVTDAKLLADAQVASIGFISQTTSWLPDHSYQEANVGVGRTRQAPSAGQISLSEPSWTAFAGLDGAFITSGHQTKIRTNSTRMELGLTYRKPFDASQFLSTLFVEASFGKYHIDADYGSIISTHVKAKGTMESLAVGLALRHKWNNGFRIEGSARVGKLRNHFQSDVFDTVYGQKMDYRFEAPYLGYHAGLGYELHLNDRSSLDFSGRYFLTTLKDDRVVLQTGEVVDFNKTTTSRLRAGVRYTRDQTERMTFYLGGYWEQEFDGRSDAQAHMFPFHSDELKGTTGVGELGIIFRSTEDRPWNVEAGLQGYGGRNRGFSGGVRFGYRF